MTRLLALILLAVGLHAAAQPKTPEPVLGGYYYVKRDAAHFRVMKVLAVEPGIVHVAMYWNRFSAPPAERDLAGLRVAMTAEDQKQVTGMGGLGSAHVPLDSAKFLAEQPVRFATRPVTEADLEGYREWKRKREETGKPWKDRTETRSMSLHVRAVRIERSPDGLEVFVYRLKNLRDKPIRVLLALEQTSLGLCPEFGRSTVPLIPEAEWLNLRGRGLEIASGQEAEQTLVAAKSCLRESTISKFEGGFLVRDAEGVVRREHVGLGNFVMNRTGTWP